MNWLKHANTFVLVDGQLVKYAGLLEWLNNNFGISIPAFALSFLLSTGQMDAFARNIKSKTPEQRKELVQKVTEQAKNFPTSQPPTQPVTQKPITSQPINVEEWVDRIIDQESSGNPMALSNKNKPANRRAGGLMQIMPATWTEMTRKLYGKPLPQSKRFDPTLNKKVGIAYLKYIQNWLRKGLKREPTIEQILAAYNGGAGRLIKLKGDVSKMPAESVNYYKKITRK